ncbi:MAG: site-specific DNA-methyltransferase [Sulfurimonas sp.]|nr:site-specific DNA-methyltransferase [Sulfurimonas sp.]
MIDLHKGDCLEVMDELIAKGVMVDAIITDPPYGTTACKWDSVIPFPEMWERLNKLIKPNGAIVLFGSEPFSSALRMSNIKKFRYDWVWDKKGTGGFLNAKIRPLKRYENILIFANKKPLYFPIKEIRGKPRNKGGYNKKKGDGDMVYGKFKNQSSFNNEYYPTDIIEISNAVNKGKVHPTQKPVALMEYLIKTYTDEDELVLDFTMGSGTTGVACKNLNRNFIGIEMDENYFQIAKDRIEDKGSLF